MIQNIMITLLYSINYLIFVMRVDAVLSVR
jgi:hypothetical protein